MVESLKDIDVSTIVFVAFTLLMFWVWDFAEINIPAHKNISALNIAWVIR